MNKTQLNFKSEMKAYEKREKMNWKKEVVTDIETKKKYIHYYNSSSILMKTEEYISPYNTILKIIRKLIFFVLKIILWIVGSLLFINYVLKYLYESGISNI